MEPLAGSRSRRRSGSCALVRSTAGCGAEYKNPLGVEQGVVWLLSVGSGRDLNDMDAVVADFSEDVCPAEQPNYLY